MPGFDFVGDAGAGDRSARHGKDRRESPRLLRRGRRPRRTGGAGDGEEGLCDLRQLARRRGRGRRRRDRADPRGMKNAAGTAKKEAGCRRLLFCFLSADILVALRELLD